MDLVSRDDLAPLLETRPGWHISMFMPMIQRRAATQQSPFRCKTLLRQVEEQLLANGLRSHETEELLQPIQRLLPNRDFWQRQSHGLALFIAPQIFRAYRVPLPLDELTAVGVQQWGSFDSRQRTVDVHQEAKAGDEDLFDVAAMYTLLRRGTVHALTPESVPERTPAAAITRY